MAGEPGHTTAADVADQLRYFVTIVNGTAFASRERGFRPIDGGKNLNAFPLPLFPEAHCLFDRILLAA